MKPKTKMHYEIVSLSDKLPMISQAKINWAYKRNFKFYAWKTKHKAVCFECGHGWDLETNLITKLLTIVCPSCGKNLKYTDGHAWRKKEEGYFQIMTVVGDYQVIRVVQMYHWMMKSIGASYSWHEIYQHWIHNSGKFNIMSTGFNGMGYFNSGQGWTWNGPMELRANQNDRYFINSIPTYPNKKILPNIFRNGFTGEFFKYNPGYFFAMLLGIPRFETFLKAGQYSLVNEFNQHDDKIEKYWLQIRICLKNHYIITDAINWFDYLELLKHFHRSLIDPILVCPADLKAAHDYLVVEKRLIDDRNKKASEERKKLEDEELKRAKKNLMDLHFTDGEIVIVTLQNAADFKMEEKVLEHCVYSSGYHKKPGSLIMSARISNQRVETIEISLRNFTVMQCRGFNNKDSSHHKEILKLINRNLTNIKKASKLTKEKMTA
jgi:DNA-directed RNA polymerase subunit RPC12/RpoP